MTISKNNERIQVTLDKEVIGFLDEQAQLEFRTRSAQAAFVIMKYLKERGYPINIDTSSKE
ncbi:hypothetical protein GTQ43_20895 [Nostoc sp. KVJ3]|uniref:ribbon-helix-helix domain-containing protein n=1 Tax=Nostoc sp. KVJ3 TaxID=457945 RepID=UPI0022386A5E|nr:hypothetical protein [Nostoc sp. KVJ3]MCW5315617.1 hypothetical protein [Nostoc sp. KVJ3]MCW5316183.1 hypothetical protein [Nostoc sp. KVJ3]